ncbi:DUF6284 family protein [Couchioplanes caeruleus]|uniref:Uncharacterized protein n=2 Tax=Couchioplanes caeruleus TaxID=56438 RepID=A0A1K0FAC3_9ACTN|nr:DUF6284 family protein [Couchioplanes caeruleus]OJF09793.1 hypothetical protein BG844_35570 [Couchioplanes caeruleus subsp. caeruleus]ROP31428.1 hypothetical protein EDD30_4329 [Couchioplanes caeruleus]
MRTESPHTDEPAAAELAAIEAEEPLIAAEVAWLAAEIAMLDADDRGGPTVLDWRRLRRAEARVIRETFAYVAGRTRRPSPALVA